VIGEHVHIYPDDWTFGGADGTHPGADPRFETSRYWYFDERFDLVDVSSAPVCDGQAVDEFTRVARLGFRPVYIGKRNASESTPDLMPWRYDPATDEVEEIVRASKEA
jgi:hypothetical protein